MSSENFVVRYDVPLPPVTRSGAFKPRGSKYPLAQLEVGGSFAIEPKRRLAVRSAINNFLKTHPTHKFATRVYVDEETNETVAGVWRVE